MLFVNPDMKKILFQVSILIALFFGTWFTLNQLDWMRIFKVKQMEQTTEEKLGNLIWDLFNRHEKEIRNKKITDPLDSILSKICLKNNIDRKQIKLHIIQGDEINAFALPNNHLVIYKGLIAASESEAELSGVIGHELAHIELNHVMKKLIKEVGLSVLISMTTGHKDSEVVKNAAKLLSSTAYDRSLEQEADVKSVDYLIKADMDPEPFANFLYKVAERESKAGKHLSWISTHPDSKERAEYIIEYSGTKSAKKQAVLAQSTWATLQDNLLKLGKD